MKRTIAMLMLAVMFVNIIGSAEVKAFELREGDSVEEDENYEDVEFGEVSDEEEDEEPLDDKEYEEALEELDENYLDVTYKVSSSWEKHANVEVTIKNSKKEKIEDWEVKFESSNCIENIWNAAISKKNKNSYVIKNSGWNQDIEVDSSISFGMTIQYEDKIDIPDKAYLTKECREVLSEYKVTYKEYSHWGDGDINGEITIHNLSNEPINDWKLELETNIEIKNIWNALIQETDDNYVYLNNANYNATIPAKGTVSFGFIGKLAGDDEAKIDEYYLYDMLKIEDEETQMINEVKDGYERSEDDFATEEQYMMYKKVVSYIKIQSIGTSVKDDKSGFALPAYRPRKVTLGKNGREFEIRGVKIEYFNSSNDEKPSKTSAARAIQSYAKYGSKYYIAQRVGSDVFVSTCTVDKDNPKVLNFDENSTMRLNNFAHGQTFEFVKYGKEVYMLMAGNTRKEFAQSLALVKYKAKSKLSYGSDDVKKITKTAYANQNRKYCAKVGRVDAAVSSDQKTLCVWFANDVLGDDVKEIKTTKVQIACFDLKKIVAYFQKDDHRRSLSFQSMSKSWCYYSCEQKKKNQIIRPYHSNQGIEVSNTYKGLNDKGKKVNKNKVYFSSGDESLSKPLYISMMTLYKKNSKDLSKNGSYRTQLQLNVKKIAFKKNEIEGLHLNGNDIWFIIAPHDEKVGKSKQYICSIPKSYMNEGNYKKRS